MKEDKVKQTLKHFHNTVMILLMKFKF